MKRFLISILVLCAAISVALEMVSPTTLQLETVPNPLGPWNSPDVKVAQQYGYLKPVYPTNVSTGYVRFYLSPAWTNVGNGKANMRYYDLSNAQVASNQATADLANTIAASNAAVAQTAYESSNAVYNAQSEIFPLGRGPVILAADGFGYQPIPDPASGTWLLQRRTDVGGDTNNVVVYRSDSVVSGEVVMAVNTNAAIIATIKALRQYQTNLVNSAQSVDPTVWSGAQKTNIIILRSTLIDTVKTIRDLEQALLQFYRN